MGSPVEWDKVAVYADTLPYSHRGWSFVRVIEREVLDKNRKALVITGATHLNRLDDEMYEDDNLVNFGNKANYRPDWTQYRP